MVPARSDPYQGAAGYLRQTMFGGIKSKLEFVFVAENLQHETEISKISTWK